jgi:hypothetical protein
MGAPSLTTTYEGFQFPLIRFVLVFVLGVGFLLPLLTIPIAPRR